MITVLYYNENTGACDKPFLELACSVLKKMCTTKINVTLTLVTVIFVKNNPAFM